VDDLLLIELKISLDNLIHAFENIILCHFLFYFFVEITGAKLSNDVSVIFCRINLVKCKNIRNRFKFFENLNFRIQKSSVDLIF